MKALFSIRALLILCGIVLLATNAFSTGSLTTVGGGAGGGGGTQYREDDAHSSGDTGTLALGVRNYNPNLAADNSANSSSKVPTVGCVANAADPSWTEGRQVPCSVDLSGHQRNILTPATSGGTSTCYITSAASTNATNCKASAGQIYGYDLVNTTATLHYLRLYNLASSPTCSSATGFVRTIPIAASTTGAGIARDIAQGEAYGTGIGFCLTGGGSSTDNTNAATGVYIAIHYK